MSNIGTSAISSSFLFTVVSETKLERKSTELIRQVCKTRSKKYEEEKNAFECIDHTRMVLCAIAPSILVVYWLKISLFGTQQMKQFLGTFVGLGHYTP